MKVLLVTNPPNDGDFRVAAERLMAKQAATPEGLQGHLRDEYPRAHVVRGIEDHGVERWYAYRDGSWVESG